MSIVEGVSPCSASWRDEKVVNSLSRALHIKVGVLPGVKVIHGHGHGHIADLFKQTETLSTLYLPETFYNTQNVLFAHVSTVLSTQITNMSSKWIFLFNPGMGKL